MRSFCIFLSSFFLVSTTVLAVDPAEIVFAFQKQKDPAAMREQADKVAAFLSKQLGMTVKAHIPSDYAASVQALISGTADIAYVDSLPFLLARRDAGAKLLLAEERMDVFGKARTDYDSIFVVPKDSRLTTIKDLVKDAKTLRIVFTSPTSTSGYIMPYRRFVQEGLIEAKQDIKNAFKSIAFAGGYTQALEQVASGRADVCAVSNYTMEGLGADSFLKTEERAKLRILERTPGVPTHVITARAGLSDELLTRITNVLLSLSSDHPELLRDVYGASHFVKVEEGKHVLASAQAVEFLGLPIDGLVPAKKAS